MPQLPIGLEIFQLLKKGNSCGPLFMVTLCTLYNHELYSPGEIFIHNFFIKKTYKRGVTETPTICLK